MKMLVSHAELLRVFDEYSDCEVSDLMLANAACSLRRALAAYQESHPTNEHYKYAIMLVAHSIEILLKARVAGINKQLILLQERKPGQLKTIQWRKAEDILVEHGVSLSTEERDGLRILRELRNDTAHFAFLGSKEELDALMAAATSFWWGFLIEQFPHVSFRSLLPAREFELAVRFDAVRHRATYAARTLIGDRFDAVVPGEELLYLLICDYCCESTLLVDESGGAAKCYKCGSTFKVGRCSVCGEFAVDTLLSPTSMKCRDCLNEALAQE